MHVYYKLSLFWIFIHTISLCCIRAAPATNQTSTSSDDYDYNDYYDENETISSTASNELLLSLTATTTTMPTATTQHNQADVPRRSRNHFYEPTCPESCLCLEDHKYVQCSNAQLTQVPSDMPSTALIIDLSQNHIYELGDSDFANCTKVREINLNGNNLTQVNKHAFNGLSRLQRLNLGSNRLTNIEPDSFYGASDLSKLDLSNNYIVLNPDGPFLRQPGLLEFACRNCSWSKLYDDTFANWSSLTALKLDQNDFNKKINTKAFRPLHNLIKLQLPELDQVSIQELCNLLRSIDNISFKHFDVSCYELVLGASYNDSVIFASDPPYKLPTTEVGQPTTNVAHTNERVNSHRGQMASNGINSSFEFTQISLIDSDDDKHSVLAAGIMVTVSPKVSAGENAEGPEKPYQVPVSQETINMMLIAIMIIAIIGIIIGLICRKDVGGIKTKCCRTRKPEAKDQVHPAEEIPLNKLA